MADNVLVVFIVSQLLAWLSVAVAVAGRIAVAILSMTLSLAVAGLGLNDYSSLIPWIPWVNAYIGVGLDLASLIILYAAAATTIATLVYGKTVDIATRAWVSTVLACYASLAGLVFAWTLPLFYVYWELLVIASTVLVALRDRGLGIAYFAYMQVASLLLLAAIGMALAEGVVSLNTVHVLPPLAAALAATAFAVKLGVAPFHTWLLATYTRIGEPSAAILSGVVTVAGAYGLYRFTPMMPESIVNVFAWIGVVSALLGSLAALASNRLVEIASYSSIGHGGFIAAGLSAGGFAAAGSLYLAAGHSLAKPLLFLVAHVVRTSTGEEDVRRLGLLLKTMPLTSIAAFTACMSLAGVPGFALFPGELATILEAAKRIGLVFAVLLAASVFASACYAIRLWLRVFWHPPVLRAFRPPGEPGAGTLIPLLILTSLCILVGLVGGIVIPHIIP